MELLQLKYFSHAAKTENFSRTAQNFMVPTSGVSSSIKKLENELGVKLFDRTANTIKLNKCGKILLDAIDKSEELFYMAKADMFNLLQTPSEDIHLLILTNRQFVTKVVSEFRKKYPQLSFHMKHQGAIDSSHINEYDIIITDENITSNYFEQSFWIHEELFLAVHKNHPLSGKNSIHTKELKKEKFICMSKGSSLRRCIDFHFEHKKINPNIVIECDDPQYIREYVKMDLGVTLFPASSWKKQRSTDIHLLRIDDGLYRDSYIYTKKASSNMVHLFAQMLKKHQIV